ncbi:protein TIC 20-I, chloroplastic-like [Telopea speciosissima]|uniref:protein TIC 20-I, chloroplastic-like n=1 Tax=Telopea speciosissima TaxID=54955 RepID=UPI001CC561D2|nr:protein TIC 20-I, chloroplastic-like [Telopea speciosissima]
MILNGCSMNSRMFVKPTICNPTTHKSAFTCFSQVHAGVTFPRNKSLWAACKEEFYCHSRGWPIMQLSTASTPIFRGDYGSLSHTIPVLRKRSMVNRSRMSPRASKDVPSSFRYPQMTKKPRWWWRMLACIPYLMPLHETWMYAETAYHLHPFLEDFEFLTYPFLGALGRLPAWFLMAYFFTAYLGVVRRKEWPHFFRFHVVMGMLLEITLQVIGTVSRWLPLALYWGKFGMHVWTAIAFAYLFTVLESMRCALAGMYADVPFVCDAAYIQIPYD